MGIDRFSSSVKGCIFDTRRFSVHDGPGIRTTVFFKGCPASCRWCHNPESQSFAPQLVIFPSLCISCGACASACTRGAAFVEAAGERRGVAAVRRDACVACGQCVGACPAHARSIAGRCVSVGEVAEEVEQDRIFYDESGGGVTFSGGEPLAQPEFLKALASECRIRDIHVAVDTSGFGRPDVIEELADVVDIWLYDLKAVDSQVHDACVGCSMESALDNLRLLLQKGASVILRVPLVFGVNLSPDDAERLGRIVLGLGGRPIERVDLLPYHRTGEDKYARIGRSYDLLGMQEPDARLVSEFADELRGMGFAVKTGG